MPAMIRDQSKKPGRVRAASGAVVKSDAAKAVTKAAPQSATGKTSAKLGKGVIAVAPPSFRRERALLPPPSFSIPRLSRRASTIPSG